MSVQITLGALENEATRKVGEISGENVYLCMQCGTCSSVCPMADSMHASPRKAMLLMQHGQVDSVLDSKMPWLCASCHACQVRCPRGIEVTRVMDAVRQLVLRQNHDQVDPRAIPPESIAEMPQIALVSGFRKLTS